MQFETDVLRCLTNENEASKNWAAKGKVIGRFREVVQFVLPKAAAAADKRLKDKRPDSTGPVSSLPPLRQLPQVFCLLSSSLLSPSKRRSTARNTKLAEVGQESVHPARPTLAIYAFFAVQFPP